jgi:hypothetical protein
MLCSLSFAKSHKALCSLPGDDDDDGGIGTIHDDTILLHMIIRHMMTIRHIKMKGKGALFCATISRGALS